MTIQILEVPIYDHPMLKRRRIGFEEAMVSDGFARLSEAMYMAEQKAKEAAVMRSKAERGMAIREKERKEQESRAMAQKARYEGRTQPHDKNMKDIIKRLKKLMVNGEAEAKSTSMEMRMGMGAIHERNSMCVREEDDLSQ